MFDVKSVVKKYDVLLKLEIKDDQGNIAPFNKKVLLRSPPYIGLKILFEDSQSGNPIGPIEAVTWNKFSEIFFCQVKWRLPKDVES